MKTGGSGLRAFFSITALSVVAGCPTTHTPPAECRSSRDCSEFSLVCDPASATCVECVVNTDCLAADAICAANHCQTITHCVSSRECPGLVCDPTLGYCVECVADVDCPMGQACSASRCIDPSIDAGIVPADVGPPGDVGPRRDAGAPDAGPMPDAWTMPPPFTGEVDLLMMIDNSNSMTEEQASIVQELPRIVTVLTTGDRDGNGVPEFTPASSLHIGIVDSDMGLGDVTGIATCDPGFGDDGLMQIRSRTMGPGCLSDYSSRYPTTPNVFAFRVGGPASPAELATDVSCVARLGTDGCGFEAELESPLKAISLVPTATGDSPVSWTRPGYHPPTFFAGTFGHGSDPSTNGAFLRPASILAILTVNDEDDCSTANFHIFSPSDPAYNSVGLNLRCHTWNAELYPVQRYVDGFLGLRTDPTRLVYAAITGVPPAVAGMAPSVILRDPAMVEQIDPVNNDRVLPACVSPGGRGVAYPAVRMTQVADGLERAGAITSIQSICNTDFSAAIDDIMGTLQHALDTSH